MCSCRASRTAAVLAKVLSTPGEAPCVPGHIPDGICECTRMVAADRGEVDGQPVLVCGSSEWHGHTARSLFRVHRMSSHRAYRAHDKKDIRRSRRARLQHCTLSEVTAEPLRQTSGQASTIRLHPRTPSNAVGGTMLLPTQARRCAFANRESPRVVSARDMRRLAEKDVVEVAVHFQVVDSTAAATRSSPLSHKCI